MSTDTERLTVSLSDEDYQWVVKQAELTGNSRAGILRQIVRGLRLGRPGLLPFEESELVFADRPSSTGDEEATEGEDVVSEIEQDNDNSEEGGLEAFRRE